MAAKAASAVPLRGTKLSLGFGLVDIPVQMKLLVETQRPVPGKGCCPEHGPQLHTQQVCSAGTPDEHVLADGEKVIGYPHPDNPTQYVVVDKDVIKALEESRSGHAKIEKIVDAQTIDPIYFDKTYVVWAQDGREDAFDLFCAVLRETDAAAVVTAVLRKQTQHVVLRWAPELGEKGCLVAHVVRFESQIRHAEAELVAGSQIKRPEPTEEAMVLARQILGTLVGDFDASESQDTLTPVMNDAIRAAGAGKQVVVPQAAPAAPVVDLMAALQASVAAAAPEKKPARKKKAA